MKTQHSTSIERVFMQMCCIETGYTKYTNFHKFNSGINANYRNNITIGKEKC